MWVLNHLWLIPVLPLAGAAGLGLFGRRLTRGWVHALGVGSAGLSLGFALAVAYAFFQLPPEEIPYRVSTFTWLDVHRLQVEANFYLDPLSLLMVLVVTGVGFLIHVYSAGYMAKEEGPYRYFAYLNLFMFFMLLLVLAGNYLLLFVGWEGVGLCSYLLIGFSFRRDSAAQAGQKAFVVNRIGDLGFTLALLLLFWTFGSLDYAVVFAQAGEAATPGLAGSGGFTLIALLLFTGAIGKSAQLPLYVWLPDAMEGPTPVSALIHAATMVAAGVYIVARSHLIFAQAPLALAVVAGVGCLTAFYAATIGLVQTDIKRILAYSTISQLGYMFLGLGVGAFSAAVFHLMTHAFFKALLFLAAGSVIHALSGQQDIRKMGDLRDRVPTTYWTFFVGALAIADIPGFAGFFSKDGILWQTFAGGHLVLWPLGLLSTGLTSFYIFRLIFLTFHGQPRYTPETARHIHESPPSMTGPLVALALLSIAGGWVGLPAPLAEKLGAKNYLENFLGPVFERSTTLLSAGAPVHTHPEELALMAVTVLVAAIGIGVAYTFYLLNPQLADGLAETFNRPYRVLLNKYYVDELYQSLLIRPLHWLSDRVLWQVVDVAVIDGAAHGTAARSQALGQWVRRLQSGNTRSYAAWVVLGAVLILSFLALGVSFGR